MSDLYAAIEAAIAEDELKAHRAGDATRHWEAQYQERVSVGEFLNDEWIGDVADISIDACGQFTASHIARHDPARVLRQVAAHWRILELHSPMPSGTVDALTPDTPYTCDACTDYWPCDSTRALASIYGIGVQS